MGVDHGGEQVVGRADRVDVAGEVEVDVLHRDDLRVPAAGGAALDAEDRAERRLAKGEHRIHAENVHRLGEPDSGDGLALAQRRRCDGGHVDDLAVGLVLEAREQPHVVDLGLVAAVELELVLQDARLLGDRLDRLHGGGLGDLNIARHRGFANGLRRRSQRVLLCFHSTAHLTGGRPVPGGTMKRLLVMDCTGAWPRGSIWSRGARRAGRTGAPGRRPGPGLRRR